MAFDPSRVRARLASEQKWYSIKNTAGGDADVMLYGEIGWLGTAADEFVRDLKQLQTGQINLHLSSPGGSVFDGIAIMNALKAHPANVTVYVDSLAASIASVIAMAGDRIVARQASEFMIHEASGLTVGNAADMREMAELLDRQSDKIAAIYAARAGGTVEEWRAAMAKETWFSAEEAVAAGLADEVDTGKKRGDDGAMDARASWDLSVFRYPGREQAPAPQPIAKAKTDAGLTFTIGDEIGAQLLAALAKRQDPTPQVSNVLRQFDEGDIVRVVGTPHMPGHTQGCVAIVNGNAYGVIFDGMEEMGPHLWYVDNELEFVADGPDREGEGYGEEPEEPEPVEEPDEPEEPDEDDAEELRPGVSHPMGRPVPTGHAAEPTTPDDQWTALVAHLTKDEPDTWSALVSNLTTTASSSAATEA